MTEVGRDAALALCDLAYDEDIDDAVTAVGDKLGTVDEGSRMHPSARVDVVGIAQRLAGDSDRYVRGKCTTAHQHLGEFADAVCVLTSDYASFVTG